MKLLHATTVENNVSGLVGGGTEMLFYHAELIRCGRLNFPKYATGNEIGRFGADTLGFRHELNVQPIVGNGSSCCHLVGEDIQVRGRLDMSLAIIHGCDYREGP